MLSSFLSQGAAVSLALLSLLPSPVAAEIFEKLSGVPNGELQTSIPQTGPYTNAFLRLLPGWRYANNPHGNEVIRLQIALQQHDVAGFEQAVMDMSTPGHADYGKHFRTHDEMKRMLLPSDTAVDSVRDWLESAGVHNIQVDADWVKFHTTVNKANALLDADFKWYVSEAKHIRRLRTLQYSIPDALVSHINMIQPTTRFGQIQPNRATMRSKPKHADETFLTAATLAQNTSHCDSIITPHCLKQLYNIGDYQADPKSGSKVGFASYLEEYARYADLERFEQHLAPNAIGQNFSVVQFNGGLNDQLSLSDSGEANLDLQYILGVSAPVPVTEYSTGGRGELVPDLSSPDPNDNSNEPYLDFLQGILKLDNSDLPQVISTSYGEDEQVGPLSSPRTTPTNHPYHSDHPRPLRPHSLQSLRPTRQPRCLRDLLERRLRRRRRLPHQRRHQPHPLPSSIPGLLPLGNLRRCHQQNLPGASRLLLLRRLLRPLAPPLLPTGCRPNLPHPAPGQQVLRPLQRLRPRLPRRRRAGRQLRRLRQGHAWPVRWNQLLRADVQWCHCLVE